MKALIFAAGRGTRISRYLSGEPKCTVINSGIMGVNTSGIVFPPYKSYRCDSSKI